MQTIYTASPDSGHATIRVGQTVIKVLRNPSIDIEAMSSHLAKMDEAYRSWHEAEDKGDHLQKNIYKLAWLEQWVSCLCLAFPAQTLTPFSAPS
jgi:hypothetical protein